MIKVNAFQTGDRVVVRVFKRSTHPGPRAMHVRPEQSGDGYQYEVDKFWAVSEVRGDKLVLVTRRGKLRFADLNDPGIRHARWWERIAYRDRFPQQTESLAGFKA